MKMALCCCSKGDALYLFIHSQSKQSRDPVMHDLDPVNPLARIVVAGVPSPLSTEENSTSTPCGNMFKGEPVSYSRPLI